MREMGPSFVTVAAQGFYRSRVRNCYPLPNKYNPNQIFLIGDGFGLFVFFEKFEDTHFRNGVVKRPESRPRGPRKPKLAKDKEANYENHQKL